MASAGKVSPITRGNWASTESYTRLDIVASGGNSYIAKKDSINIPVENTEYWQLMARGGSNSASDINYSNTTSGMTATNVQTAIDELAGKEVTIDTAMSATSENAVQNKVIKAYVDNAQGKALTSTLAAGETELVFTDSAITTDSTIDPYTSKYTVVASDIVVEAGKITMTFDEQEADVSVKVVIK